MNAILKTRKAQEPRNSENIVLECQCAGSGCGDHRVLSPISWQSHTAGHTANIATLGSGMELEAY